MKQFVMLVSVAVIMAVTGYLLFQQSRYPREIASQAVVSEVTAPTFKDAPFVIEGTEVRLANGVSEVVQADSAAMTVTTYFGKLRLGES